MEDVKTININGVECNIRDSNTIKDWGEYTITPSSWSGSGPYISNISVIGMSTDYNPTLTPIYTSNETVQNERKQLSYIYKMETNDDGIIAYAYRKPTETIKFKLLGV